MLVSYLRSPPLFHLLVSVCACACVCVCSLEYLCMPLELINSCRFFHTRTHTHTRSKNDWFSTHECQCVTVPATLQLLALLPAPAISPSQNWTAPPTATVAICFRFLCYTETKKKMQKAGRLLSATISRWRLQSWDHWSWNLLVNAFKQT